MIRYHRFLTCVHQKMVQFNGVLLCEGLLTNLTCQFVWIEVMLLGVSSKRGLLLKALVTARPIACKSFIA